MGKYGQVVMGPAGSGKSTYCSAMARHCEATGRQVHVVNLDPAAEHFDYNVSIDIRDLISLQDVMDELGYGPNGGLIYCMEYLLDHLSWLSEALNDYGDDYLIFDCPGQIELYTHLPVMQRLLSFLSKQHSYNLVAIYLLDSLFITDSSRFISGSLMCLAAMIQLELPHINVLSKCDLVPSKKALRKFLDPDMETIMDDMALAVDAPGRMRQEEGEEAQEEESEQTAQSKKPDGSDAAGAAAASSSSSSGPSQRRNAKSTAAGGAAAASSSANPLSAASSKFSHLNRSVATLLSEYSLVNFFPLNLTVAEDESIAMLLQHIDRANAYGEDLEPKEPMDTEHEIGLEAIQE